MEFDPNTNLPKVPDNYRWVIAPDRSYPDMLDLSLQRKGFLKMWGAEQEGYVNLRYCGGDEGLEIAEIQRKACNLYDREFAPKQTKYVGIYPPNKLG